MSQIKSEETKASHFTSLLSTIVLPIVKHFEEEHIPIQLLDRVTGKLPSDRTLPPQRKDVLKSCPDKNSSAKDN